jgi:uncharacterized membrane protein
MRPAPGRSTIERPALPAAAQPTDKEALVSDLVAIAYPDLATARRVASRIGEAQKAHVIALEDMVVVERRGDGNVKLHQPSLAGAGATGGALWGGLIGLIFLAPVLGMAVGAAAGAALGAVGDTGVDDRFMKGLGARLETGGAAVILLVRDVSLEKLLSEVDVPGEIIQTSLDEESEEALRDALAGAGARAA